MHFFYEANPVRSNAKISIRRMDATKKYLVHYERLLELQRISMTSTDRNNRLQASVEMTIAERKLRYWERQENFDQKEAFAGIRSLKLAKRVAA